MVQKMKMLFERATLYNRTFPDYPPLVSTERWLYGVWVLGNNYQSKQGYYGEYPPAYLKRVTSLFPDCTSVLHLFSGSLTNKCTGIRFDSKNECKPDVVGNAEKLSNYFPPMFDIIYADPPYSNEDANRYGQCLVNRNKVLNECHKVLVDNGFLVWLDQVLPMYRKTEFQLVGTIGLVRSTNHRVRMVFIFQKQRAE